ncbi:unnamed protein product [Rotaria sordida]|uniref:F-box domain-containing protein n=1 Tax=Rotaria sordida TaxID=392033 RepID=A0A814SF93_9BILA|nr:unnamed protein product [Rotaria sordida]CAF1460197.1 unnamed protein product [Rotaria sordida]
MNQCNINLLDLPTEILITIFKKLDNIDILYSLFDVNNQRLDKIIKENICIHTLNFVSTTLTDDTLSISDRILDRFCMNILPRIHYNIKSIVLNSLSMERILRVAGYPNLSELKIFNFNGKIVSHYLTVESPLRRIFQRQITDLILVFENSFNEISCEHYSTDIYGFIFKFFENLKHLSIIGSYSKNFPPLILCNLPSTTYYSSTLYKLCIHVMCYDDLLALLDGRLKQLNTLNVVIIDEDFHSTKVYNTNNLPDLKYFNLQCNCLTDAYYNKILPLLRRMLNIEVLNLNLILDNLTTFIDGKHIYNEIIVHMSKLNRFNFCFCNFIELDHLVHHLSKDDILQTFNNITDQQVDCMIKYRNFDIKYHVFTLPFIFDNLYYIDNTFSNIIFNHVLCIAGV